VADLSAEIEGSTSEESRDDAVSVVSAAAMHGLFDLGGAPPVLNDPLPPLWHWLAFLPNAPQRDLGSDGHPSSGIFHPPPSSPRRMFAGARYEFLAPVAVGQILHRQSRVTAVTKKKGRSGDLLFVELTNLLYTGDRLAIQEIQNLVYRAAEGEASNANPNNRLNEGEWEWQGVLQTNPVVLFRFCALTYNAHRIHYDRQYTTQVEGYPGLIVPGPMLAVALSQLAVDILGEGMIHTFEFRAVQPIFDGDLVRLRGRRSGANSIELAAYNALGQLSMTATANAEVPSL